MVSIYWRQNVFSLIPHQSMLYMAHNCHDEEVELIAIRAINITLPKLIEFAKVHPPLQKLYE